MNRILKEIVNIIVLFYNGIIFNVFCVFSRDALFIFDFKNTFLIKSYHRIFMKKGRFVYKFGIYSCCK